MYQFIGNKDVYFEIFRRTAPHVKHVVKPTHPCKQNTPERLSTRNCSGALEIMQLLLKLNSN